MISLKKWTFTLMCTTILGSNTALFAQGPDPSNVYIRGIMHAGTGCPAGTVSQNLAGDARAFTLLFDSFIAESGPGVPLSAGRRNCQVNIDLQYPQGWSYSIYTFDYRGFANLEAGSTGQQSATYYFQGTPTSLPMVSNLRGPYVSDYHYRDTLAASATVWSPCGATRSLNINASVAVQSAGASRASMTVDSIDGEVKHTYSIVWRQCGVGPTPTPTPAPAARVPVYRKVHEGNYFDFLFTTVPSEAAGDYRLEGIAFNVFTAPIPGTVPLYRCFSGPTGHFLSLDGACEVLHIGAEAILGYVAASPWPGTTELVRCHGNTSNKQVFITTRSRQECAQARFAIDGPQGYSPN